MAHEQPIPNVRSTAQDLLDWYDIHQRSLPWRARAGEVADPYRVWLSEIMLQQTTVVTVKPYFAKFIAFWPDIRSMAAAPLEDILKAWAGLGYYARARNLYACARMISAEFGGVFPDNETELLKLPGVGAYTAAAITAIAFQTRAVVIDGNVERVISRLFCIKTPLPQSRSEIRHYADLMTPDQRCGDYAQAMMDLGATVCTPKSPLCALCPLQHTCLAHQRGLQAELPAKTPKPPKPVRRGAVFAVFDAQGRLLVRTRPQTGLLGGMTELPGTDWIADAELPLAPLNAPLPLVWRRSSIPIRHVFTHFTLELSVFSANTAPSAAPSGYRWIGPNEIAGEAFPTVFRKAVNAALALVD